MAAIQMTACTSTANCKDNHPAEQIIVHHSW